MSSDAASTCISATAPPAEDPIVQYIVIRTDLEEMGWNKGAIITQACHAATTAIYKHKDDLYVRAYFDDVANLRKVTLQAKNEDDLRSVSDKLTKGSIDHVLWIEQPENIPTSIATKLLPKSIVSSFVKSLRLLR